MPLVGPPEKILAKLEAHLHTPALVISQIVSIFKILQRQTTSVRIDFLS